MAVVEDGIQVVKLEEGICDTSFVRDGGCKRAAQGSLNAVTNRVLPIFLVGSITSENERRF